MAPMQAIQTISEANAATASRLTQAMLGASRVNPRPSLHGAAIATLIECDPAR